MSAKVPHVAKRDLNVVNCLTRKHSSRMSTARLGGVPFMGVPSGGVPSGEGCTCVYLTYPPLVHPFGTEPAPPPEGTWD